MKDVLIFKTNINSLEDFRRIEKILYAIPSVSECTIDIEDEDKILRVISENLSSNKIENEICKNGFFCKELND